MLTHAYGVVVVLPSCCAPAAAMSICTCAGKTLVPLEGDASISRTNETNLGNYVCDAFLRSVPKAVAQKAGGNVTICLMNAGGIRSGYKVGRGRVGCDAVGKAHRLLAGSLIVTVAAYQHLVILCFSLLSLLYAHADDWGPDSGYCADDAAIRQRCEHIHSQGLSIAGSTRKRPDCIPWGRPVLAGVLCAVVIVCEWG